MFLAHFSTGTFICILVRRSAAYITGSSLVLWQVVATCIPRLLLFFEWIVFMIGQDSAEGTIFSLTPGFVNNADTFLLLRSDAGDS